MNFLRELLLRVLIPILAASVTRFAGRGIRDACAAVYCNTCYQTSYMCTVAYAYLYTYKTGYYYFLIQGYNTGFKIFS